MNELTVLVPLDGSALAEAALPYGEAIAAAWNAALLLLAVVEREEAGLLDWPEDTRTYLEQLGMEQLERYLNATAAGIQGRGYAVATRTVLGDPSGRILGAVEEYDVSLTVMATHGRGGLQRWLVGSVADKVMRLSGRPILLVRPPESGPARREVTLRRLLVPLDGSRLGETALPLAVSLAGTLAGTLTLIQVVPWRTVGSAPYGEVPEFVQLEEEAARLATAYLERVRDRLPEAVRAQTVVLRGGNIAATLAGYALHEGIDLVVMSTHGRGGLRRAVLGSTADRLVRSGAPTLLVPPGAKLPASSWTPGGSERDEDDRA
jgi:nucleotide-binding universal stress UspA family protein